MKRILMGIAAAATLGPFAAVATPIAIQNASFEKPAVSTFTIASPPGWVFAGFQAGVFRPSSIYFNAGFPTDGLQSGYANVGSSLTQDGVATIFDGVTYTLLVDVGRRKDPCCTTLSFEISLLADGVSVASVDETDFVGGPPDPGDWKSISLSLVGDATLDGRSLGIELFAFENQTNWDNVRLSDSTLSPSVPEPATVLLLGLGLAGLGLRARRRKFKHLTH